MGPIDQHRIGIDIRRPQLLLQRLATDFAQPLRELTPEPFEVPREPRVRSCDYGELSIVKNMDVLRQRDARRERRRYLSIVASWHLHSIDSEPYLDEILRLLPYGAQEHFIELAPKLESDTGKGPR